MEIYSELLKGRYCKGEKGFYLCMDIPPHWGVGRHVDFVVLRVFHCNWSVFTLHASGTGNAVRQIYKGDNRRQVSAATMYMFFLDSNNCH